MNKIRAITYFGGKNTVFFLEDPFASRPES
jgi:hypothetical protein